MGGGQVLDSLMKVVGAVGRESWSRSRSEALEGRGSRPSSCKA